MATPKSHEDIIREFANMVGNTTTKPNRRKLIARKIGFEVGKLAIALLIVVLMSTLGWAFINTLSELGLIGWSVTLWQAIRLISPVLLVFLMVPVTLNIRIKQ